jgi:hypothetical protein
MDLGKSRGVKPFAFSLLFSFHPPSFSLLPHLGSGLVFELGFRSFSRMAIKSFGDILEIPEKRKYLSFPSESPKASWKIEEQ